MDKNNMKSYDYYRNAGEYPTKPKCPQLSSFGLTAGGARQYADAMEAYEPLKAKFDQDRDAYNNRMNELEQEFKKDALEDVGLTGHPKADKAYNYAWQQGHAHGFSDVFSVLSDIAEILL